MVPSSLTVTLVGTEQDGGAVLLGDFREFMDHLASCLRRVERVEGATKLRHRIADLKAASATVTLEPIPPSSAPEIGRKVYTLFEATIRALESGSQVDRRFKPDDLKVFRELATPVWKGDKKVEVAGIRLTTQFVANIDKLLGQTVREKGTIKGRAEKLNVHNRHEFTLYPPIGEYTIVCTFPEHLFETVRKAIKRNITVTGLLTFRGGSPYPERVQVESIEVHLQDEELPTLRSLRGLMPEATSGGSAVEFVQALRDE